MGAVSQPATPTIPRAGETIEVSIVNVDVVVTDRAGKRVHGLTQNDFEILQDGKPQPITNFAEYSVAAPASGAEVRVEDRRPGAAAATLPPPQKRTIVLFADRFSLPPFQRDPLFDGVKKMLHEIVRPGDSVSIVSWRRLMVTRLNFTDDIHAVDDVLEKLRKESTFVMTATTQDEIDNEREWLKEVSSFGAGKGFNVDVEDAITVASLDAATRARLEQRAKIRAINSMMKAISGAEGKKVLFLMTHRFSRIAGQEFLTGRDAAPHVRSSHEMENDMANEIESVVKTANANGVTVYPFFPEGLQSDVGPDASRPRAGGTTGSFDYILLNNELDAMKRVADGTGGVLAWGAKNVIDVLPAVQDDFESYYSLAYRATGKGDDRGRKIVVRTKERGLSVRSRHEVVEKSDVTKMKDRVVASLITPPERSNLTFEVNLGRATRAGRNVYKIPVSVRVPMRLLMTLPQNGVQTGGFSAYVAWGSVLGEMSEVKRETRSFIIEPGEKERVQGSNLEYAFELLTDEKTDRVAIGVVDEITGESGIRRINLPPRNEMMAAGAR